jgi:peroxiredoxin
VTVIQIGSLAISLKWLLLGLAVVFALITIKLWLRQTQQKEIHKSIFDLIFNALFLGFVIWKASLILLEPSLVIKSPMSLLYFTGGTAGLVIAIIVSIIFFLYKARKFNISQFLTFQSGMIFSFSVLGGYFLLSYFLYSDSKLGQFGLGLFSLLLLGFFLYKNHPKEALEVIKKLLAIMILSGLIGWVAYDHFIETPEADQTVQKSDPKDQSTDFGIQEGNRAPNFQLKNLDGEEVALADLKGKKVILNLWATWCPPCKAEMPHMQEFYHEQQGNDVEILAVNLTTAEKDPNGIEQFVMDYGLTFPVVLDTTGEVGDAYQAFTIPTSYILDTNGVIQKRIVGPMDKQMMTELINNID